MITLDKLLAARRMLQTGALLQRIAEVREMPGLTPQAAALLDAASDVVSGKKTAYQALEGLQNQ